MIRGLTTVDRHSIGRIIFARKLNKNNSTQQKLTQNRTEQNIYLFRHSAYIAHSLNTNTAWKRKMKNEK